MNKSIIPDPLSNIGTATPPLNEFDDNEWVAIKDTFPTLNSVQTQATLTSDKPSQSNENNYKFEVESTGNAEIFTIFCRKMDQDTLKKNKKLQLRVKTDPSSENREISQEFELIDVHSEQLSIERIQNAHRILFDLFGEVKIEVGDEFRFFPTFPELTTPPYGLWAYLSSTQWDPSENCRILEEYFADLYQFCPFEVFMEVLFLSTNSNSSHQNVNEDENHLEKYEECFSELNKNTYQSNIKKYRSALQSLEESKSSRDIRTIEELLEYYCELDDAFYFFERALSEMFHYDSQPILEDYQAVVGERDGVREVLLQPSPEGELSDEEYLELCDRERAAHEEVLRASSRIHELTIYHLQELAQLVESQFEQTKLDREVCSSLWEKRTELRLLKLESKLNDLLISLLSVQVECLKDAKERTILIIVTMDESDNLSEKLKKKESTLFTVESQIIDIKLRLIAEQEAMYKHKMVMLEEDKENREVMRSKLDKLGRRKARLRTRQRTVTEGGKGVGSGTPNLNLLLEDSFYSELVLQKRRDANSRVASSKQDRLKKERVKVIQRVKQTISENPKEQKKLPPSYLPPSQRKGTLLDTTNNRKQRSQPNNKNTKTQPTSRLTQLNISPSMAHHYPSIDSSISLSVNSENGGEKKNRVKKLQPRTIRNSGNTTRSRGKPNTNITQENVNKNKENNTPAPNYNIPPPPPDIPDSFKEDTNIVKKLNIPKNVSQKSPTQKADTQNPHETMMKMIRGGIRLKPMKHDKLDSPSTTLTSDAHASLLKVVATIGLSTQDSDSDSPNGEDSNW